MIVINAFAVSYINRSGRFIYAHRERVRAILKEYASAINQYNERFDSPPRGKGAAITMIVSISLCVVAWVSFDFYEEWKLINQKKKPAKKI